MAIQEKWVDALRTVIVGLRAPRFDAEELRFLEHAGVRMWTPWDMRDQRLQSQLRGDITRVGQGPAYVSVDLDVLDPAFCPAVAEPVPGGLTPSEALWVLDFLREWRTPWLGADLMELSPILQGGEDSARAAMHLVLRVMAAESKAAEEPLKLVTCLEDEEAS
jgi:arginase family enzyme